MHRSYLKHFGKKARDMVGLEYILYRLGEVAWNALRRNKTATSSPQGLIFTIFFTFLAELFRGMLFKFKGANSKSHQK